MNGQQDFAKTAGKNYDEAGIIKPTIGRVVLVFGRGNSDQAEPALITYVWTDTLINVGGFTKQGMPFGQTSIQLDQFETRRPDDGNGPYCQWMPYQKAQAASARS